MNREIEWQFQVQQDQLDDIKNMLIAMGTTREGEYLMPIIVYNHPTNPGVYIRVRHEGRLVSFTVKTDLKAEFPIEHEVEVEPTQKNIDELNAMLLLMGCLSVTKINLIEFLPSSLNTSRNSNK